jgi:hypothetical protein
MVTKILLRIVPCTDRLSFLSVRAECWNSKRSSSDSMILSPSPQVEAVRMQNGKRLVER